MVQERVQRLILTGPEIWSEWKTQLDVYAASIRAQDYLVLSEQTTLTSTTLFVSLRYQVR